MTRTNLIESPTVESLNFALAADPAAIRALLGFKVPCNEELAISPGVFVDDGGQPPNPWTVSALGLLNGILLENGLPRVAAVINDDDPTEAIQRFVTYGPDRHKLQQETQHEQGHKAANRSGGFCSGEAEDSER
jgi:hypothetical protein